MARKVSKRARRAFTPEFKAEAVSQVEQGASVGKVARDLGLAASTLRGWVARVRGAEATKPHETAQSRGLSPKQDAALVALLSGGSVTEAAAAASVTRETCSRWLNHDAEFQAELAARQEERRGAHERLIGEYVRGAAQTLHDIMSDASAPHSARVSAAKVVLGIAMPNPIQVRAEVTAEVSREEPNVDDLLSELWSDPVMRELSERLAREDATSSH